MEDIIMNTIRIKNYGEFVLGKYRSSKDILRRKDITDSQVMAALGKSKTFNVRDWFGGVDSYTFTITDIEKTEYGDYIYTIKTDDGNVPARYFPNIMDIVGDNNTIAVPVGYSVLSA